jgi:hypothetical protein
MKQATFHWICAIIFPVALLRVMLANRDRSTEIENNHVSLANSTIMTFARDTEHNKSHGAVSVLSYSLYGNKSSYVCGMVETAKQDDSVYPGWEVRVYHNNEVPANTLRKLASLKNVRLINVVDEFPEWVAQQLNPASWRFLVASDPAVEVYAIRDADSRPSIREKAAVDEWIRSGMSFHVMRDHPAHDPTNFAAILAGMWGGLHRAVPNIQELLREYSTNNTAGTRKKFIYGDDQDFLWKYVLPLATNNCLQHDSYYCVESGGIAFPMTRQEAGSVVDFVGNAFNRMVANGTVSRVSWDKRLGQYDMVNRYNLCLELRHNLTKSLEKTMGSSNVLPGTPYKGRSDKPSTQLWAEFNAAKRRDKKPVPVNRSEASKTREPFSMRVQVQSPQHRSSNKRL